MLRLSTIAVAAAASVSAKRTALVVGGTGATGHHVVQRLLDEGYDVKAIVRSKDKMNNLLNDTDGAKYGDHLFLTEATLLDMPDQQLKDHLENCHAVACCLGHNPTIEGLWGHPRRLVTDSVTRLTSLMPKDSKFVLMGTDGVSHPTADPPRDSFRERLILTLLRKLLPPHVDNEEAASYLYSHEDNSLPPWSIVRPTNLVDGNVEKYDVFDRSVGPLFGNATVSRASVADFMVNLIISPECWEKYKYQMPVIQAATEAN